ncbi:GNAT family N-acetyltransferase [Gracilibacillus caseinilyticus]|uniref:GNAT family N-acetyltransferase n=1 Tax=Gracilibacillus caseinilyticus TaxID=2932256 RepID=A0ABY4EWC9_9BACI|nr:GNAT family protein [Gracilibacillus caseinilyticus]UOQ48589.1 GNAT family N-acetyltransferase [Gracilibacillus caseinilyticus]
MKIADIYGNLPLLETNRLRLRKIKQTDIEAIFHYASQDRVSRYVTWNSHESIRETTAFVEFILEQYKKGNISPWGIEFKETGEFIGTVDFVTWDPDQFTAEIGYVITPEYWGRGIVTEAVKELFRFGFTHMKLERIQARCLEANIASARVMEKAGMTYEGTLRHAIYKSGKHYNLKIYSILRQEFDLSHNV